MRKISSNKTFGLVFFIIFLLIAIWPLKAEGSLRVWSLVVSLIFLILGLINSKLLGPLNYLWVKLGEKLGKIVSPFVMGVLYFTIITPIGIFLKITGKDLLSLKFSNKDSYWIKREKNISTMEKQF